MDIDRPRQKDGIRLQNLGDECLLYDGEKEKIHILNPMAGCVWTMCDGSHSREDMETELRRRYQVAAQTNVGADIDGIMREFMRLDLIAKP